MEFKEAKSHIRSFMQAHYSDERLAEVLAFCQDGKFGYVSCCCFIGAANAQHALRENYTPMEDGSDSHLDQARMLDGGMLAEAAFFHLADEAIGIDYHATRRRILIPMIRAEMRRRERVKILAPVEEASWTSQR